MKIKQLVLSLLLLITFTNIAYAQITFISHNADIDSENDKISYGIQNFENLEKDDVFKLEIYNDAKLIDNRCSKQLNFDDDTFYKKIICDQSALETGEYTFVATITRNNNEIVKTITKYTLSASSKSSINYEILEDKTIITINVESTQDTYQVEHYIPKEIIKELTIQNQNDLIESELEFEILDSDPIIAWNIDESPKTIQYTIKKQTKPKDLENLNVKINSSSTVYSYLSYVLYLLILIIIGIIIKPMFKKIKK
ncbi:MAG: hypothetical protein HRU03_02395 [Nanoarchaeales archaeon]|nr:hypothetical protein [Nanoarchaeales archaeon]